MDFIMWKDSYLVGVDLIDDQHKYLFKAIEKLINSLKFLKKTNYKKQLYDTTAFLKDYCLIHFNDEQEYMKSIGFEGYEAHKQKHDKLLGDAMEYRNKLIKTNFDHHIVESFLGFLTTWIIYHVGVEDQQIPKKELISSSKIKYDDVYHEYADNVKEVLNILAGLSGPGVSYAIGNDNYMDSGVCYQVMLKNAPPNHSCIGFVYSDSLAYGLVKEMTDMDAAEFNDLMYSALQEISAIIGAKIAGTLSRETGSTISIELPKHVQIGDINKTASGLAVYTQLGAMEVFFN